ncbi:MAG: PAS domain-containing protein, partial [Acidobacteriota bacterium]
MEQALALDLFDLMLKLSQLDSVEKVLNFFPTAVKKCFKSLDFRLLAPEEQSDGVVLPIATHTRSYGRFVIESLSLNESETLTLALKIVEMLAVVLEKIENGRLLAEEHERFESVMTERTSDSLRMEKEERRRIGGEFRESERRIRDILENVHLLALMLDTKGNVLFCNDFLLKLSGWTREQVIGHNWFDLFVPEDVRATVKRVFDEMLLTGDLPPHFRNPILTKRGENRIIDWNNSTMYGPDGEIIGVTSIGADMTDRILAEEALQESESRYRLLIESSPLPVVVQTEGKISYANPAGLEALGAERLEQLEGRPLMAFIHKEHTSIVRVRFRRMTEELKPVML